MKHPLVPRGSELGFALASGILLTLSFPPFHLFIPPFVALVPYLIFLGSRPGDSEGAAAARRSGFWLGVVYHSTLLYWLFTALVFYTWLALLGYVITVVILSAFLAGVGWAVHRLRTRHGIPFWASLPVLWTAGEWLAGHLGDLAFPWLGLGVSLTAYPWLVGFADITGVRGVTAWIAAINGILAEWWLAGLRVGWVRRAALLALTFTLPAGYSLARWYTLTTQPAARVLAVQPNIPEDVKLDREAAEDSSRVALDRLSRRFLAGDSDVDLVVWPETALPNFFKRSTQWTRWAASLARAHDVPLLFGTLDYEFYENGGYDYYNGALLLNSRGMPKAIYWKHYLVPIVERVPFIPVAWMRAARIRAANGWRLPLIGEVGEFLQWFGGFGRGTEAPVMQLDGSSFGVLICYESIFPGHSRRYRRAGAEFLVNITNDAWFGRERPWWSRTSALFQHPSHLVMRSIENRMGVARAANTGISMFVDPLGRVHDATRLFEPDAVLRTVETSDALTFYTRIGDWPGWLAAVGSVLLIAFSLWRGRPRTAGPG